MLVQWFAHMPAVSLTATDMIVVPGGALHALPFDHWNKLDPSFPWAQRKYEQSKPTFYIGNDDFAGSPEVILDQVNARVFKFYQAMLLGEGAPILPEPPLSVLYIQLSMDEGVATMRLIGPLEREWVVYGNRIAYNYDESNTASLGALYSLAGDLERGKVFPGVKAGFDVLARTARPEFWHNQGKLHQVNGFIQCMAAVEDLLMPSRKEAPKLRITPTIGRHAALLLGASPDDLDAAGQPYANLYRLRSRLIHGEIQLESLSTGEQQALSMGRVLLQKIILRAMALQPFTDNYASLPALMLDVGKNQAQYQLFKYLIEELPTNS